MANAPIIMLLCRHINDHTIISFAHSEMTQKQPAPIPHKTAALGPEAFDPFRPLTIAPELLAQWLRATHIVPASAMSWMCAANWQIENRSVQDVMWFCIEEGSGDCRIGESNATCRLEPGDLFLIPKAWPHAIVPDKGVTFRLHTIHFSAHLYNTLDLTAVLGMAGVFKGKIDGHCCVHSRRLAREFALQAPGYERAAEAAIWDVLLHIIREHGDQLRPTQEGPLSGALIRLQPAFDMIDKRLDDPTLRVPELADELHVSEVHLRKLFHKAVAMGPVAFIRSRRIERACRLLRTTDRAIKSIAAECAFAHLPFFYRTFRKSTGMTPANYRKAIEL
jgi:AraC-like DNA-binding protein/mannose-6-phosphate isomerase-like protein (cupin superfamily)